MMEFIKKNYIYVNITILLLAIYIILFPIISNGINSINPNFTECPYLKFTGNPCPFCGGTRYIANLPKIFSDVTYLFHPFGIMAIVIILELFFRTYIIFTRKKDKNDKIIKVDIAIHILLMFLFLIYILTFYIK